MTVYPGSQPARQRDRATRRMPDGWKPTPPTAAARAVQHRKLADDDRHLAELLAADHPKAATRRRREAVKHDQLAEQYDLLALQQETGVRRVASSERSETDHAPPT